MNKTQEIIVNFRRARSISIVGEEVEVVEEYEYLSFHLDNRLNWRWSTDSVYRKGQSRLYLLRKVRSFSVCSRMFFYKSVVVSSILSALIC